jgi:hypothetical protein
MRIAFWWKLNWSWFCLIQTSYNAAILSPSTAEIHPFPSSTHLSTDYSTTTTDSTPPLVIKKEENNSTGSNSPTPRSSDQDTISEPMEDIVTSEVNVPPRLQRYWDLAKRLNRKPKWPGSGSSKELGSEEWIEVGDFIVELGHELARFGLLDLEVGFWENEIMHRMDPLFAKYLPAPPYSFERLLCFGVLS